MRNFNFFQNGDLIKHQGEYCIVTSSGPRCCILNNKRFGRNEEMKLISRCEPLQSLPGGIKAETFPGMQPRPRKIKKQSGFVCLECGHKFRTVKAAEKAVYNGCPKCNGVDIDISID